MTYREKVERDAPYLVRDDYFGGVCGCPGSCCEGAPYVGKNGCALMQMSIDAPEEEYRKACSACWDQEVADGPCAIATPAEQ